jgi:hypothetical protein
VAQVGDVLMTARADVGQAKQAFRSLQADVKQASADFKAGVISIGDYQTAIRTARQEAISLRSAGLAPVGRELSSFSQVMVATTPRIEGARRGLGTLRGAMVGLAGSMVGVRGPLNALVSGLLLFGTGGAIGAGVAAGLAALAFGFNKLRQGAKDAAEAVKTYADAWRALPEQQKVQTAADLAKLQAQQADINLRLAPLLESQRQAKAGGIATPALNKQIEELQKKFIEVSTAVAGAMQKLSGFREDVAKTGTTVREALLPPLEDIQRDLDRWNANLRQQAEAVKDALSPLREYERALESLRELEALGLIGHEERLARGDQLRRAASDVGKPMFASTKAQIKAEFDDLGLTAAGAFTRGFIRSAFEGFKGFGSVLKNVFASLFEDALMQALRRLGGGGGGSGILGFLFNTGVGFATGGPAGAAIGGAASIGIRPPGPPEFSGMNINVGPARDPISIARDAQWLAALAASNLQLEAGGFRLARR